MATGVVHSRLVHMRVGWFISYMEWNIAACCGVVRR